MDAIYRYQRFIYDASRKYYLLGRDRLIEGLGPPPGGTVLEVACGTGRNLIKAARRYPQARFYGFDISGAMLDTARGAIVRHRLADRVSVGLGDATDFSGERLFGVPAFDRVFVSYSLSMIPPWRAALRQAFGAVAPGGTLHIVDFGDQSDLPRWFRSGLRAWLAKFSVEPRAELEAELKALAAETGARLTFQRMFRDYAQRAILAKP
jgi:S-adenosylmethionine-diacylgycerolhomoserine-N-methlytransferase